MFEDDDFDDRMISLDDMEREDEQEGEGHYDWGDELDDMDSESWEKHYGDEDEELEGDPWALN